MKPQPILRDMPHHIKQNIVSHVDIVTKLSSLILCSKEYKSLVEQSRMDCFWLGISFRNQHVKLEFQPVFRKRIEKTFVDQNQESICSNQISCTNYLDEGIKKFTSFMKNQQSVFKVLSVMITMEDQSEEIINRLREAMSSLGHLVSVQQIHIFLPTNADHIISILPFFKAGTLKSIDLAMTYTDLKSDRVVESLQWQKAKSIYFPQGTLALPYSKWQHFESSWVKTGHLTRELVKSVIKNFQQNKNIEFNRIKSDMVDYDEIKGFLEHFEQVNDKWRIGVPVERQYLEITLDYSSIEIKRC